MLPTLRADPRVKLVAGTDPRPEAGALLAREFGARIHADVAALCADPEVEVVYVATPHQMHAEHVRLAAAAGKHALVEKPMAINLAQCQAMVDAARAAHTQLIIGHSHSFDLPYLKARAIVERGRLGAVRMVNAQYYTDFLYRPRRPEELDTAQGGGVIFSQAAHQIDIVRLLCGGRAVSVRAQTGAWDPARPTEGAYAALISFTDGVFATVVYSGYGAYDGDELAGWVGESGHPKNPDAYTSGRAKLAALSDAAAEAQAKAARNFGGAAYVPGAAPPHHQHFGHVVVCCERGDIRPGPAAVVSYGAAGRISEALPAPAVPRREVIDELWAAVREGVAPLHDGAWSLATLEVCLAILESARTGREVPLHHQVAPQPVRLA
ncbi:MAG: Gfo/Idh/MocA family oxidoreductase [Burkholderiales bacterium]|nr:Gfo/Idh/MocA family oxidoreductase [Burkholderiales bacterium]